MKVFVPLFRHMLPPTNPRLVNEMFLQIDPSDLRNVVQLWRDKDQSNDTTLDEYLKIDAASVCKNPTHRNTLEPYMRRPHISVNCGSSAGSEEIAPQTIDAMGRLGALVARSGHNAWCGGGKTGLMRAFEQGFLSELNNHRYPDQYAVQVCPAWFMFRDKNEGSARALNEGLNEDSHVAIVMPDFFVRRDFLNRSSAGIVTGWGSIGSLDETTETLSYKKIGMNEIPLYMLDVFMPKLGRTYWYHTREQIEDFISTGFEKEATRQQISFMSTPEEIMGDLMTKLDADERNPHMVYAARCREQGITLPAHPGTTPAHDPA